MAGKKKGSTKKKAGKKSSAKSKGSGAPATATLETDDKVGKLTPKVTNLPKGQTHDTDGTICLKNGEHLSLPKRPYNVHGIKVELEGDTFVAAHDVNWLSVKNCTCGVERPGAVDIQRVGESFVVKAQCKNKKCKYGEMTYVWVWPESRMNIS